MLPEFLHFKRALKRACRALDKGEWPVGAVIIKRGKVIASAENMVERLGDPTAHAEILAANRARQVLKSKYLEGCTVLVTLQPCEMCWYYLQTLRVGQIIWGASSYSSYSYSGHSSGSMCAHHTCLNTIGNRGHKFSYLDIIYETACQRLLIAFGNRLRKG